jgi:hypothetical protein
MTRQTAVMSLTMVKFMEFDALMQERGTGE